MIQQKQCGFIKKIKQILLNLDLFGTQVNLTVKKQDKHTSPFGTLASFLITGFCLYTFISMFSDMISGKNPYVISDIEFVKDPDVIISYQIIQNQLIELTKDSFALGITIVDKQASTILQSPDQMLFVPLFYLCNRTSDEKAGLITNCTISVMKPCSQINASLIEKIDETGLVKMLAYCLDDKVWESKFFLEGFGQSPNFKIATIDVKKCTNNTYPGIVCAPKEVIQDRLKAGFFGIVLSDRLIQQKSIGNPYKLYGKTLTSAISSNTYTQIQGYFRHSYSYTIQNFYYYFGESQQINHELQFEKLEQYSQPQTDEKNPDLVRFIIQLDDKKITYYRTYNNVLNIFGDIGGLLSLILFLANIFLGPIERILLDLFLTNQIFSVKIINNDDVIRKQQQMQQISPERQSTSKQNYIKANSTTFKGIINKEQQRNENLNELKNFFKQKFNKQRFGLINYLTLFFSNKRKRIDESIEKIYEKIDILYLIKKVMEIDKLKYLLLTNDQIKLFEYLPKPIIDLTDNNNVRQLNFSQSNTNSNIFFHQNQSFIDSISETFYAYKNIKWNNQTQLDKKLLNMLDEHFKALFDETISGTVLKLIFYR